VSTSEDALRMVKIQHAKIGNTWCLQHDEAQANPWSVSYAGNVSILDSTWCQKCKDTKLWWLVSGRITMCQVSTLNDRANKVMGIIQSVRSDTVLANWSGLMYRYIIRPIPQWKLWTWVLSRFVLAFLLCRLLCLMDLARVSSSNGELLSSEFFVCWSGGAS
jgi:hypothetical protein